jgi:hypothetical protein
MPTADPNFSDPADQKSGLTCVTASGEPKAG